MIFKAQQGHNNARTQERLSVKNTQTSNGGERNLRQVSKKIRDAYERITF